MTKDYSSSASWNSAALAGLVMAAVTIALDFARGLASKLPGVGGGVLSFFAWALKLVLCAWTFRYLMKRFYEGFDGVDSFSLKRYGLKLALFSSIIVSAYSLVSMLVINPDTINEIMNTYRETYASMMDSNSEAALEKMLPKLPTYIGLVSVVYCFLWGWLYSSLFSKSIAPFDPFADIKDFPDNQ